MLNGTPPAAACNSCAAIPPLPLCLQALHLRARLREAAVSTGQLSSLADANSLLALATDLGPTVRNLENPALTKAFERVQDFAGGWLQLAAGCWWLLN